MAWVAALLDSRSAVQALRRTLPKSGFRLVTCRGPAALRRLLTTRLLDAIVLAPAPALMAEMAELHATVPGIPVVGYAAFRPDDGDLILACRRHRIVTIAIEGVDDPVVGDLVARHSLAAERRRALHDAPRMLRLTEPLQRAAWDVLLGEVERPIRTERLARRLEVSREHLSRQFGAGGAPNLKRVIDLTRICCAAQLLANPGYPVPTVVRVLNFASSSHLRSTARRIANVTPAGLVALGPRGVLGAFTRGNTRSRN